MRGARLEPFEMQPELAGPVRQRVVDDRLDRREVPFAKRNEERVAPDPPLRRNQNAERRKPVLIDEMLERHRRRVGRVRDIMATLAVVPRIDAERMRPRPILGGRDHLALRERGRQASLEGDGRESRRLVEGDRNARAGHERAAQPATEIAPRRADGVAPGRMQRSADASEAFAFDELARRWRPLGVQQIQILVQRRGASLGRFGRGVYARTRPLRQGPRLIHRHELRPGDFADFEV